MPYKFDYKISFIYNETKNSHSYKTDDIMAIDLGVNNLATIITRYNRPIIVDGKFLKSKNRYFNKKISVLQSIITKGKKDLKNIDKSIFQRLSIWYSRRDNYIRNFLHKSAKRIIDIALTREIKKIVIGYNRGWKQNCSMGRKNNEKFYSIPHLKLLEYIKYRALKNGIEILEQEESYTSKCDALGLEDIKKHTNYKGKRVKRGLFQSSIGKLINADVNGALNILRKSVSCNSLISEIAGRGFVFQPLRVYI